MGIYDLYRRLSLEDLQAQANQQATQYASQYQGWMTELDIELQVMHRYGASEAYVKERTEHVEQRRQELYAHYATNVAQLQADTEARAAAIHQDYDAKDQSYNASMAQLRGAQNATPESPIGALGAPADLSPSYTPHIADNSYGMDTAADPEPEPSLLGRIAGWLS